jgi:hypothetical protein
VNIKLIGQRTKKRSSKKTRNGRDGRQEAYHRVRETDRLQRGEMGRRKKEEGRREKRGGRREKGEEKGEGRREPKTSLNGHKDVP